MVHQAMEIIINNMAIMGVMEVKVKVTKIDTDMEVIITKVLTAHMAMELSHTVAYINIDFIILMEKIIFDKKIKLIKNKFFGNRKGFFIAVLL